MFNVRKRVSKHMGWCVRYVEIIAKRRNEETVKISWSIKESEFADLTISSSWTPWRKELSYQHILEGMHYGDGWWWMVWESFPPCISSECVRVSCSVSSNNHFWIIFLCRFARRQRTCSCTSVIVIKTSFHCTLKYESFPRILVEIFACLINLRFSV